MKDNHKNFIKGLRLVRLVFRMRGWTTRILNLDGMTLALATETIKHHDWGIVASPTEFLKYAGSKNGEPVN